MWEEAPHPGSTPVRLTKGPDTDPRTSLSSPRWPLPKDRAEVSGHQWVKSWEGEIRQEQHGPGDPLPFYFQITKPWKSLSRFTIEEVPPLTPSKATPTNNKRGCSYSRLIIKYSKVLEMQNDSKAGSYLLTPNLKKGAFITSSCLNMLYRGKTWNFYQSRSVFSLFHNTGSAHLCTGETSCGPSAGSSHMQVAFKVWWGVSLPFDLMSISKDFRTRKTLSTDRGALPPGKWLSWVCLLMHSSASPPQGSPGHPKKSDLALCTYLFSINHSPLQVPWALEDSSYLCRKVWPGPEGEGRET